jgi:hypothetical protein
MSDFMNKVHTLQWDDHRYYHQSRINQTLHFISACCFLLTYALLFINPAAAGLTGWLLGMVTRQSGHIFFEPRGHDRAHNMSYEAKEAIKVGYNMRRKAVLITVWLSLPVLLWLTPSLGGLIAPASGLQGYFHDLGLLWLALGVAGVLFRTVHLFWLRGPVWGLAWAVKIVLDPFHNIAGYWSAPLALLQGQLLDPRFAVSEAEAESAAATAS